MVSIIFTSVAQSSLYCISDSPKLSSSLGSLAKQNRPLLLNRPKFSSTFGSSRSSSIHDRGSRSVYFSSNGNFDGQENGLDWPMLKRWDAPWQWQTASLTSLACGLRFDFDGVNFILCIGFRRVLMFSPGSFVLTGLAETSAIPLLGIKIEELSLDEKAELLLLDQSITTVVVIGVLFGITNTFQPLPEDIFRYDLREPFDLQRGWLLWAVIGLVGALLAIALTGVAMSAFSGETPQRETDALVRLLPLIGSSSISTACLVVITGVLAPVLEETVFRGFFMVSLTKWVPTPIAVLISAAVFAIAHLTPGEFPQLFILGTALGFSYAQTRNLLTSITIHAFWNSGVILILTLLQLQGYDIKELLQAT